MKHLLTTTSLTAAVQNGQQLQHTTQQQTIGHKNKQLWRSLKSATTPAASTATATNVAPQYKRQVHLAGLAWQDLQHIFTPQSNSDNKIQKSLNNIKLTLQKEANVYKKKHVHDFYV